MSNNSKATQAEMLKGTTKIFFGVIRLFSVIIAGLTLTFAQRPQVAVEHQNESEGFSAIWYVLLFVFSIALFAVILELRKRKKSERQIERKTLKRRTLEKQNTDTIDATREIEWYRKKTGKSSTDHNTRRKKSANSQTNGGQELVEDREYVIEIPRELPIFQVDSIETAQTFSPLPLSNDESLLSAIEQVKEEYEEDEEMRELALRILANFKTRNSVDAVSELALYDFSSKLRSQAVMILADFDHESVFESLLLACADPSREVRAAAARALFRISFDRHEAWLRIYESPNLGKVRQCARALIAGDLVIRSLERLTHQDKNYAVEALCIALILIKAGETAEIFNFLKNHSNPELKKAILHVIKIAAEPRLFDELISLNEQRQFPAEMRAKIEEILETADVLAISR